MKLTIISLGVKKPTPQTRIKSIHSHYSFKPDIGKIQIHDVTFYLCRNNKSSVERGVVGHPYPHFRRPCLRTKRYTDRSKTNFESLHTDIINNMLYLAYNLLEGQWQQTLERPFKLTRTVNRTHSIQVIALCLSCILV